MDVQLLTDVLAAKYSLPATWPGVPGKYHMIGFQLVYRISGLKELSLKTVPDRQSSDMGLWWEQGPRCFCLFAMQWVFGNLTGNCSVQSLLE